MNKDLEIKKLETMNDLLKKAIRKLEFQARQQKSEAEYWRNRFMANAKAQIKDENVPDLLLSDVEGFGQIKYHPTPGSLQDIQIVNLGEGPLGSFTDLCIKHHIGGL